MQLTSSNDYLNLLTSLIKKHIVIFGPDITLAKIRRIEGITVHDDGTVLTISKHPRDIAQKLLEESMDLSSLVITKTMLPLIKQLYPLSHANLHAQTQRQIKNM